MAVLNMTSLFSGIGMQERGVEQANIWDLNIVQTCEMDINAIINYAAIHKGLTPELVERYDEYPPRDIMAQDLIDMRIGYDFVKDKEYDWMKKARSKSKDLEKTWLACKLNNNVGDIMKVDCLNPTDLLTWSFPCFVAGTKILTTQGLIAIEKIEPNIHTISVGGEEYKIYNLFNNGIHKVFDLCFDDNTIVSVTYNHKFLVKRNFMTEWVEAINLMNDDKVVAIDGFRTIKSKTNSREETVYDIQVENIHCFPLENGVIASNCTDLSVAGKQAGLVKSENGENGTRSGLVYEVLRILWNMKEKDILPKFMIMENVDALINKKNKAAYELINEEISEIGFNCYYDCINTKYCSYPDHPTPQNRNRCYAMYIRKDIDKGTFEFPKKFDCGIRLKDILADEVDEKYYIKNPKADELIDKLIEDGKISESDLKDVEDEEL